ncbi:MULTISPECIES: sugar transferase [unclassified Adlercreutzia]|uniref:sugar transferase n=1 Tax=unclassified Adlercreutzia TaxID=2636013 RepID=UPI001F14AF4E|nr:MULTISPECIES: sugar transferase [unclassified Adlercreutzia]
MGLYGGNATLGDQAEEACAGMPGAGAPREAGRDAGFGDPALPGAEGRVAYRAVKRAFDVAFSLFMLVAFCWLFAVVAVAIKLDDPSGPVIFRQARVTKGGREFTMYKFRSMCADAEERLEGLRDLNEKTGPVFKMADDPRVTRVGRWLRKLSLARTIIGRVSLNSCGNNSQNLCLIR